LGCEYGGLNKNDINFSKNSINDNDLETLAWAFRSPHDFSLQAENNQSRLHSKIKQYSSVIRGCHGLMVMASDCRLGGWGSIPSRGNSLTPGFVFE